jgi:hypothetical protein
LVVGPHVWPFGMDGVGLIHGTPSRQLPAMRCTWLVSKPTGQ